MPPMLPKVFKHLAAANLTIKDLSIRPRRIIILEASIYAAGMPPPPDPSSAFSRRSNASCPHNPVIISKDKITVQLNDGLNTPCAKHVLAGM